MRLAHLSQDTTEIPGHERVLESLEAVKGVATLSDGVQITAALLCDRFGFRGDKARTLVRDLSGGERRRLALMRLLMGEPNVLLLDEPTNDLDIDTLTALEDLLDGWPGTLVVVSHDRYFVERVCDDVHALTPDGAHPPPAARHRAVPGVAGTGGAGGRRAAKSGGGAQRRPRPAQGVGRRARGAQGGREARARGREARRAGEPRCTRRWPPSATDHVRLRELQTELAEVVAEREALEAEWLQTAEALEG